MPRLPVVPLLLAATLAAAGCQSRPVHSNRVIPPVTAGWVDLVKGEDTDQAAVLDDLATAGVIHVGEVHALRGHHEVQLELLQALFARRVPLVLCLEQLEARDQAAVDRYARGELTFEALAREIDWTRKWTNYPAYRALCEFARQHGIPLRGLNAPAEVIRTVSRGGGLAKLPADQRATLPAEIDFQEPAYERLMGRQLAVHMAVDPARLRPMFEAQVARDEAMAANITTARLNPGGTPRTAFVLIGAGHVRYGLGTVSRVQRRDPTVRQRIMLITENEPVVLGAKDQAATREVSITHDDLREVGRPPGDYLRLLPRAPALPPGHPPVP